MLHFYYGVMGSSKTAQLLMQRYNYQQLGLKVALVKPAVDTRAGQNVVFSRVGLQADAELVLGPTHSIREQLLWLAARNAHLPVVYSFTCYDGMFAYPNATALSAGMLLSPGGARAVFSPSSALSPVQHRFLLEALVAQQHASTLGERLQRVREVLLSAGAGAAELVYIYNLLGDPMSRAD